MTDRHHLSTIDLLTWAVILGYRDQQKRDGIRILLLPLPPCPACNARVLDGTASWVRDIAREEVTINMRPCGHAHWAPLWAVEELQDHVVAMLSSLEHRMLTTDEIAREAHARLDIEAVDASPSAAAEASGYCPACGRGDCAPTPDEYEQQRQRAERAEAALVRVHHLADLIHAGAPWLSNHSELAARIRAASTAPTTTEK
ncbi:hypothetical protein ACFCWT_13365 [Streptomyces olivaceus]|uniref:hypothetical protein n=1 Tax=Streptomyces olivaceus TaxID=47716 RepID=UPI0035DE6FD5